MHGDAEKSQLENNRVTAVRHAKVVATTFSQTIDSVMSQVPRCGEQPSSLRLALLSEAISFRHGSITLYSRQGVASDVESETLFLERLAPDPNPWRIPALTDSCS